MTTKSIEAQQLPSLHHAELTQMQRHYLRQATSDNTRRAYQSAIKQFEAWGGLLPTDESTIVRYLLSQAKVINPRTLALHLTALSHWHQYQRLSDPTQSPVVRKTFKGIQREQGKPKRKAKALRQEHIITMIKQLTLRNDLRSIRNSALIQVGYFGAFRCSELIALKLSDLHFEPEGLIIEIPRSKTDQTGQGLLKALPYGSKSLCPVKAMKQWLETADITEGVVFRAINRWGKMSTKQMHSNSINPILKNLGKQCGFDFIPELSSHSLRRGLATSAARAGADFDAIKRQGGWRNDSTVRQYIEEGQLFKDNVADLLLNVNDTILE